MRTDTIPRAFATPRNICIFFPDKRDVRIADAEDGESREGGLYHARSTGISGSARVLESCAGRVSPSRALSLFPVPARAILCRGPHHSGPISRRTAPSGDSHAARARRTAKESHTVRYDAALATSGKAKSRSPTTIVAATRTRKTATPHSAPSRS